MTKQVTLVKGGTRVENQETETLRVIGTSPALMDGSSKPVINNVTVPFADLTAAANAYNALLAALRTRGVIS
ncbi:hypothetical protein [Streptomyces sp. MI02-7b]|uniref:hypothetical protein n=1 Tax=Streptomyces sp. MI02-7b TaxID=462941 RepID=UPI0029AF8AEE|nr:hypothetical protein [Streptomyces sp. MI02-7b]MDX3074616.1 hypothetical protein [Streptomyces sp. MI02-7b]